MKASLLLPMALALLLCICQPTQAQPDSLRFDSTATLNGHLCHVLNLWEEGGLMESDYFYEENGYVRFYAYQEPGEPIVILDDDNYYIVKQAPDSGDTWLTWVEGGPRDAEVMSSEMKTVPAGTFQTFEVGYSEVGGEIVATIYWADSVGMVAGTDAYGGEGELTEYYVEGGNGCLPLALDNWWTSEWTENGVEEGPLSASPSSFFLLQAYPNPFNPTAALSYKLQAAGHVGLKVYDTAGHLVATLVDGWRQKGVHEVTFDGSGLASGVYLLRLQVEDPLAAGDYVGVEKMVLLK